VHVLKLLVPHCHILLKLTCLLLCPCRSLHMDTRCRCSGCCCRTSATRCPSTQLHVVLLSTQEVNTCLTANSAVAWVCSLQNLAFPGVDAELMFACSLAAVIACNEHQTPGCSRRQLTLAVHVARAPCMLCSCNTQLLMGLSCRRD
jgi:hypothetical protein